MSKQNAIQLTLAEVLRLRDYLQEQYNMDRWQVSRDFDDVPEEWAVKNAEATLAKRAKIGELIYSLTGELPNDSEYARNIADARRRFNEAQLELVE